MSAARTWNPLVLAGTELPPHRLLAAKLLVFYAITHRTAFWNLEVYLPFVGALDFVRDLVRPVFLRALFLVAAAALCFNRSVRASAIICGMVILWGMVASRPAFSNSVTSLGCFLLLIGLGSGPLAPWLIRFQLALVYGGAAFNKLLDPAWRDGSYFDFWTRDILKLDWYAQLSTFLPAGGLSLLMGWIVIVYEFALAAGFLVPRQYLRAACAGLAFHCGMLVFTGGAISWIFLYVMAAAYLAGSDGPPPAGRASLPGRIRSNFLHQGTGLGLSLAGFFLAAVFWLLEKFS